MKLTAREIANLIRGSLSGNDNTVITGVAPLETATPADIAFLKKDPSASQVKLAEKSSAGVLLVPSNVRINNITTIAIDNPQAAFALILSTIQSEKFKVPTGIHPLACVSQKAQVGNNVYIGPFCIIEDEAKVGNNVKLMGQVYLGVRSQIGEGTLVYPQVVIREDVSIGKNCIIHAGTVIGSDGFGYFFQDGKHNKIPQIGRVIIEDDVEIGSCTTIDRATIGATVIKKGVKIDNLVQIAHNVEVGEHCVLVAQVGIAGSTQLGQGVVLAGQVGVNDHVKIGSGAQVGAQSGIKDDVEPGSTMFGSPAKPLQEALKEFAYLKRLPLLIKDIKKIKEKLGF